jgi:outer membrane protein OmpA-like peptidoglycan-associated protein
MSLDVRPIGTHGRRPRTPGILAAIALCLVLSGCAGDKEAAQSTATKEDFPNLASVPDAPPPSTPKVEREKLLQGLLADRANAEYSGETLGEETANLPPAEPPPPAPPAPEPEPAADSAESAADDEALAAAPEPEPEPAAPPVDFGEPRALIYFVGETAALTDHDRAILTDIADMYTRNRSSRVRVVGHASASEPADAGDGEGGMALARAEAVAQALMRMGVPANALETATGGATYDESQPNGVAANRRVEVFIGS